MEEMQMLHGNTVEFDLALDDIFSMFGDESEDADYLLRAQQTYNSLTAEEQDIVTKKTAFHMAPKVMKNDIRRYFSRMFMNTLNSGDFSKIQDYFTTFMTAPTKFVAHHNQIEDRFNIPSVLETCGPRLMAHYLLGTFVMYPDMVVLMHDTRITTSNTWKGTKIEMDVDVLATKMYNLSVDDWLPQLSTLEDKYQKLVDEKRLQMLAKQRLSAEKARASSGFPEDEEETIEQSIDAAEAAVVSEASSASPSATDHSDQSSGTDTSDNSDDDMTVGPSAGTKRKADTIDATSEVPVVESAAQLLARQPHIPEEYVHALCAQAQLLPEPAQLHMKGTIYMFLDETNHIQHMNMTMRPA